MSEEAGMAGESPPNEGPGVRVGEVVVHGVEVDGHTRCAHYRSEVDVVALRLRCCNLWYPCHLCHAALQEHEIEPWPADAEQMPAVLCGVCTTTLSISTYRRVTSCPECAAPFNPGCALHHEIYFASADELAASGDL